MRYEISKSKLAAPSGDVRRNPMGAGFGSSPPSPAQSNSPRLIHSPSPPSLTYKKITRWLDALGNVCWKTDSLVTTSSSFAPKTAFIKVNPGPRTDVLVTQLAAAPEARDLPGVRRAQGKQQGKHRSVELPSSTCKAEALW